MSQDEFKPVLMDLLRQAQAEQNAFFARLSPDELAATGTSDFWSAKDHVAHLTYWRKRLMLRLEAMLRGEAPTEGMGFEEQNPLIFEEYRYHAWPDLLAASDQAYDELIELTARIAEEDLTTADQFAWVGDGMPLYTS